MITRALAPVYLLCVVALASTALGTAEAQTAPKAVVVELLRPQSDDLGHYVAFAGPISFPVMGVVASFTPATSVIVNGVPAALFPINYMPIGIEPGMGITGFRATVFLNGNSPLRVVATDQQGNLRDVSYLPDDAATLQRLQFWLTTAPGDLFNSLRMANARAWVGDMTTALPLYDRFVGLQPNFLAGRHLRALANMDMGASQAAIPDLDFIVGQASDVWPPRMDLALALYQVGDLEGAAAEYQAVVAMRPDVAEANLMLAQVLADQGNQVAASLAQEAAVEVAPASPDANLVRGISLAQQGQYDDAMVALGRTVAANPRDARAYLGLAYLRFQRGDLRRAWREVERAERWGATPDPAFLQSLSARMPRPYRTPKPRNYPGR